MFVARPGRLQHCFAMHLKLGFRSLASVEVNHNSCPNCGNEMTIVEDVEITCPNCEAKVSLDQGDVVWRTVEDQRIIVAEDLLVAAKRSAGQERLDFEAEMREG